ncbi:MAG: RNA-binding transcriptional accessory protein, partial [Cytophagia bacterium]|nr:RNA-binding transcriptional accessory protein [Cytophagia bacterium]
MIYSNLIAQELSVANKQVEATIKLLEEGGTVPFIARYRKELTGSLDEVQIAAVRDRLQQLKELDKRREAILKSIEDQGKLTAELEKRIKDADTMSVLEDIYLPYKPKRKTKASVAREKGLEPLAHKVFEQESFDLEAEAAKYINEEKGVANIDAALQGARDIIAETVNESAEAREKMRKYFQHHSTIKARVYTGKEEEGQKYKDYFEWEEALKDAPSHRVLAMRRGEAELFLMLDILPPEEEAIALLEKLFIKSSNTASEQVAMAIKDSYKRLLSPSMETEMRMLSKKKADEEAIEVFAKNLHKLLMAAPLGSKRVLAIDPG